MALWLYEKERTLLCSLTNNFASCQAEKSPRDMRKKSIRRVKNENYQKVPHFRIKMNTAAANIWKSMRRYIEKAGIPRTNRRRLSEVSVLPDDDDHSGHPDQKADEAIH
jgi:hypothetical protein